MKHAALAASAIVSVIAAGFAAGPVMAGTPGAQPAKDAMVVEYADLNLASKQGQKALKARIDKAASQFCGMDEKITGSRIRKDMDMNCYHDARAAANEQLASLIEDKRLGG